MPGQRVKTDLIRKILELKSKSKSNRSIASTLCLNRNTVNNYLKLHKGEDLDDELKIKVTKSYLDRERFLEFSEFIVSCSIDEKMNLLRLWREYRNVHKNGYGYTQFAKFLKFLKMPLSLSKSETMPILFSGKVKDGNIDSDTGEITSVNILCLLFPSSGFYTASKSKLDSNSIIKFLEGSFIQLGGSPSQIVILPHSLPGCRFNSEVIEVISDWLGLIGCNSFVPDDEILSEKLNKVISKQWKIVSRFNQGLSIHSNDNELLEFGLTRSTLFSAFDSSKLCALATPLPEHRKISIAKVQKMSHIFLAEDKHYYSVPSNYIGHHLIVKYCSETVTICKNDTIICVHKRNVTPYKYTSDKLHLNGGKGWTQEYFIKKASLVGPATKSFIQHLFRKYDSPNAGYKQANAILLLKNTYQKQDIESACIKILSIGPHTYHRLKRELELSVVCLMN